MGDPVLFEKNLWFTEAALEGFSVRGAVVLGRRRALIWDTLSHPDDMRSVVPLISGMPPVVVYSHADWDHVWGTAGLAPLTPLVFAHDRCASRFCSELPATLRRMRSAQPATWRAVKLVPPHVTFLDQLRIDLGGVTVVLHHLPGHSDDAIVAFLPDRGLLLAGDTVEVPFPEVPAGCPVEGWVQRLEDWASDRRVRTVAPAHGPVGGPELLRTTADYLKGLREGRPRAIPGGLSPFYRKMHRDNLRALAARG